MVKELFVTLDMPGGGPVPDFLRAEPKMGPEERIEKARAYLQEARKAGVDHWLVDELEKLLGEGEK